LPAGVVLELVTLSVELPEPFTDAGLKLAPAPAGKPLTLKTTLLVNPEAAVTVAVKLAPPPELMVRDWGVAARAKLATLSVRFVVWARVPLVPVTVSV
jgi:hypothetical protein